MVVLLRILGKRCNDAADTGGEKGMNYFYFLPVRFVALRHDYIVTGFGRRRFDTAQYARKEGTITPIVLLRLERRLTASTLGL